MRIEDTEGGGGGEKEPSSGEGRQNDGTAQKHKIKMKQCKEKKNAERERLRDVGGTGDQSWCVFQSESSLMLWRGAVTESEIIRSRGQIRSRLLVLMKARIDQ